MASGSEVALALEAHAALTKDGVRARVVSFPSWELFAQQPQEYRDSVLTPSVQARLAIEAGVPQGWHRWAGDVLGVETFGASAPYKDVYKHVGLTVGAAVERSLRLLGRSGSAETGDKVPGTQPAPSEGHS